VTDRLDVLRDIAAGFDTHDLERIMRHFLDDAVFEGPRGSEPYGTRFVGIDAVREAFAGTTTDGQRLEIGGCDLWTFRDDKIVKKDSYWKIRPT
jgi:ketosteroid isomerase-like protein